jgi:hypothetical protein
MPAARGSRPAICWRALRHYCYRHIVGLGRPCPRLSPPKCSRIRDRPALACDRICRRSPAAFDIRQQQPFENHLRQRRSRFFVAVATRFAKEGGSEQHGCMLRTESRLLTPDFLSTTMSHRRRIGSGRCPGNLRPHCWKIHCPSVFVYWHWFVSLMDQTAVIMQVAPE